MLRFITLILLLIPVTSYGLESGEFIIYGLNASGSPLEITPKNTAVGDADEEDGIHGVFDIHVRGVKSRKYKPVGNCTVRHADKYTFSCKNGNLPLSGVLYVGHKVEESKLDQYPEAKKLFKSFIATYEYGVIAGFYRCKKGCNPSLPSSMIFVWRGD